MPTGIVPVIVGVAVLVTIAMGLDWLIANPTIPFLLVVAIAGGIFYWKRQKRSRNRV